MTETTPAVTYRELPADEWDGALSEISAMGPIPLAGQARCVVAEDDDGRVIGALFIQIQVHVEPFAIIPDMQGSDAVSLGAMLSTAESVLREDFVMPLMYHVLVADRPDVLAVAASYGLIPVTGYVPHLRVLTEEGG